MSDAFECLSKPEEDPRRAFHRHSSQYSDDDEDDFGHHGFGFTFHFGGGSFSFGRGGGGAAAEFFRHFWAGGFGDDDFDTQHRDFNRARNEAKQNERFGKNRRRTERARRARAESAAAAQPEYARKGKTNANERRAAPLVPPVPSLVTRSETEITLHLSRGTKRDGPKIQTRSLEAEVKAERDGRFRDDRDEDETARRHVFSGKPTVVIGGLAPGTRYRFRTRFGSVSDSSTGWVRRGSRVRYPARNRRRDRERVARVFLCYGSFASDTTPRFAQTTTFERHETADAVPSSENRVVARRRG